MGTQIDTGLQVLNLEQRKDYSNQIMMIYAELQKFTVRPEDMPKVSFSLA